MIFLCYMTSIINATNIGSDSRTDKNTGDNNDNPIENTNIGSKAVPAGFTHNSSSKSQDEDINKTEDKLEGAKHNLLQNDKTKEHDKVVAKDANGPVKRIRHNKKPADAGSTGSDARPAECHNESKDENTAKETALIDEKTRVNDTDYLHTQQMHEESIKHNQSLYKRWLKQRYDQYLCLGGKRKTDIAVALIRHLTWEDYQNLMLYLKYDIDSFIGHVRKSPKYLAEWYKQGIYEDDTTYVDGDEPIDDSNLSSTGNSAATENKPTERKTIEENKNDRQVKAKRLVSDNSNTHKQIVAPVRIDKLANTKDKKTSNTNKPEAKNTESTNKLADVCNKKAAIGGAVAAEKVGNEAKPNTENKNKIPQQNLDTKVTNKSDTEKQENNSNTQKEVKADEQKKQKNNLENLQNDANKLKPGTAEREAKNHTGTKENKTEDISIHKPIKHHNAAKSKQSVTASTILNGDDKNTDEPKSNTANMNQQETVNATLKKDDKNTNYTNAKQPVTTATTPKKDAKNMDDTNAKQPVTTATTPKKDDKNMDDTNAKQRVTADKVPKEDDKNTDDTNAKQQETVNATPKKNNKNMDDTNAKQPDTAATTPFGGDMNTNSANAKQTAAVSATSSKDDKKSVYALGNAANDKNLVTANKKPMKDDKHKNIAKRNAANKKPAAHQVIDDSFFQRNKKLITILMAVATGMMLGGLCLYFLHQLKKLK